MAATPLLSAHPTAHLRRVRWLTVFGLATLMLCLSGQLQAAPKTHVVHTGQRLGSIAKRYNVTIDELCKANGIRRKDPIFPGQKLVIPEPGQPIPAPAQTKKASSTPPASKGKASGSGRPTLHTVASGHTLEAISKRYGVSIDAICHASGITRQTVLTVGQQLVVPASPDPEGRHARALRLAGRLNESAQGSESWRKYSKPPWRAGYVTIQSYSREWKGYVIGPGNKVLPKAKEEISRVLGVRTDGPGIDSQLISLMAKVSDQFGGRPLRIVSGYREKSYVHDSKHKVGRALDFSIPGVPNEALRDYCRTLGNVGVGYYPNSTFVHLDVRSRSTYWVDYSGPGEPPRLTRHVPPSAARLAREHKPAAKETPAERDGAEHEGAEHEQADHERAEHRPADADPSAPKAERTTHEKLVPPGDDEQ